ncbi:MAG: ComF family protein [Tannerellaceae bacterium]|jgi:ComF family protein|nr:ComF family protein [Tannerellaceae bacterium]
MSYLSDLFFPPLCEICKSILTENENAVCLDCLSSLPFNDPVDVRDSLMDTFSDAGGRIVYAAALFHYGKEGGVRKLIHSLKYRANKDLAHHAGRLAASMLEKQMTGIIDPIDLMIPVPLHPQKRRQRGYNQSELICRGAASILNIPVHTAVLRRRLYTRKQAGRNMDGRVSNVDKAFELYAPNILRHGQHVLLVDDVITTGATIRACIEPLITVPGIRISILSLACTQIVSYY